MFNCRLIMAALTLAVPMAANATDLKIAVPRWGPPYVIPKSLTGIEYDIVKQALANAGHTMTPMLTVLARIPKEMQTGTIDAAMTMRPETGTDACYSDTHIAYRNYAISLESRDIHIDTIADLADKSVVAFQNAHLYLGDAYHKAVQTNPGYREEANQVVQAMLLYSGRIQAVVADANILRWYAAQPDVRSKVDVTQKLRLHPLFPPTDHYVAFRDPGLCADFNRGLKTLRENGGYDRIIAHYQSLLESDLTTPDR
ncbi:MAG: Extracellular solute-binding protein family [Rhodospirillaceae bacterium]|nr:MAG: Extracellular solute-binding protein family [Rhodospirillaceae bacterium]TNC96607.1 MAG: Extracellular solute-binding protein, family 3 [Stygiobacter sp.]